MTPNQLIKLTRDVYEAVHDIHGILPRILYEWASVECADPAASEMYLMMNYQVGYLGVDDVSDLSDENKQLFDEGWRMFLQWDHKTVMNNVYMESGYDKLSAAEREYAGSDEVDAWCARMGL